MTVAFMADVTRIRANPRNPRKAMRDLEELAASIKEHGLVQPIVVSPDMSRATGHYLLQAGHRRLAAAKLLGWTTIAANLKKIPADREIEVMLVENLQRANLTPLETARAVNRIRLGHTPSLTQGEIARRLGKSVAWVSQTLLLLELDDDDVAELEAGEMLVGNARELGRVRKAERKGKPLRVGEGRGWHFAIGHPLAEDARLVCDVSGHLRGTAGRRIGKTACGVCWEAVIRADAAGGAAAIEALLVDAAAEADVDDVIVERIATTANAVGNPAERLAALRRMLAAGLSVTVAGGRLNVVDAYLDRILADLARLDAALATHRARAS